MGWHISCSFDCACNMCAHHGISDVSADTSTDSDTHSHTHTRADANADTAPNTNAHGPRAYCLGLFALVN